MIDREAFEAIVRQTLHGYWPLNGEKTSLDPATIGMVLGDAFFGVPEVTS